MTPQPSCMGEQLPLGEGDFPHNKGTWLPQSSCPCFCPKFPKEHMIQVVAPRRTYASCYGSHVLDPSSFGGAHDWDFGKSFPFYSK